MKNNSWGILPEPSKTLKTNDPNFIDCVYKIEDIKVNLSKFYYCTTDPPSENDSLNPNENELSFLKLLFITTLTNKLTINIQEFCDDLLRTTAFQNKINFIFDPITLRNILQTGLYGSLAGCKVHVTKEITPAPPFLWKTYLSLHI